MSTITHKLLIKECLEHPLWKKNKKHGVKKSVISKGMFLANLSANLMAKLRYALNPKAKKISDYHLAIGGLETASILPYNLTKIPLIGPSFSLIMRVLGACTDLISAALAALFGLGTMCAGIIIDLIKYRSHKHCSVIKQGARVFAITSTAPLAHAGLRIAALVPRFFSDNAACLMKKPKKWML